MKQKSVAKLCLAFGLFSSFAFTAQAAVQPQTTKKSSIVFKNDEDKMSYIIGHQIASSIHTDDLKVNKTQLIKAIEDGLSGKQSELSPQESQAFMQQYLMAQQKVKGEKNLKEGEEFLAKNKSQKDVVTLASGLQYKIVTAGTGEKPKSTDTVTVDYEGTLVNGKVFDSSYQRGQPVSFPVNGVIKGWTEALQLMPVGSTWMLYIPANLAYGAQAPSPAIGQNSTLVFKVHLISVAKAAAAAAPTPATKEAK
jgi:FKBP-type peptidyl-prolyl cis-trans isomerase FklB